MLLRNCVVDFVAICNVYVGKMIVKAAKRIFNSDKICRSYSDLNFGVTFLEHSVVFAKSRRLHGRQYFTDLIGLSLTTVIKSASNSVEIGGKKRKIRAITAFKIIQDHRDRYQSKAHMRLPISD